MAIQTNIINQGTAFITNISKSAPFIFLFVLIIGLFGILSWWYLYQSRMNITTIIFAKRGMPIITKSSKVLKEEKIREKDKKKGLFKLILSKSGFFKIKGEWFYKIKDPRITIPCPNYDHLIPTKKGNILFLRQESMDDFIPLKVNIDEDSANFEAIPEDIKLWSTTMKDRLRTIYSKPSFIEKYGAFIMVAIAGIIILLMIFVLLNKFEVLQSISQNLASASETLKARSIELPATSP